MTTTLLHTNFERWNRKFLNAFWVFVIVSFVIELISLKYAIGNTYDIFISNVARPTILLIVIVLGTEITNFFKPRFMNYLIIISSTLMCVVIINNHSLTDTVLTTLFFPILISIFYFDKKLTYLSGMLSLSAYLGLVEYNY